MRDGIEISLPSSISRRGRAAAETFRLALPSHNKTDSDIPFGIREAGRGFCQNCRRLLQASAAFESAQSAELIDRYRLRRGFCILQVAADPAEMAAGEARWRYA